MITHDLFYVGTYLQDTDSIFFLRKYLDTVTYYKNKNVNS